MPEITIKSTGRKLQFAAGASLMDVLLANDIYIDNACGGKGVCGKCRVRVMEGDPGAVTETERSILTVSELREGVRLACLCFPEEDLTVGLMQQEKKHEVLTSGFLPDFSYDVEIRKVPVVIHKPTLEDQTPFEDQILAETGAERFTYEALSAPSLKPGAYTAVLRGKEILGLEAGDTSVALYGVAIDIGTTTVVGTLVNLLTGEELANASEINAQKHFGLDVLTRITYELEHPEDGADKLRKAIVGSINRMIGSVCRECGIPQEQIYEIAVGANCTMMHMLLGVDATSIGKAPFAPVFVRAKDLKASDIGLKAAPGARLYCLPSVSAYIGADIVAGAYVCDLKKEPGNVMFIDIGTNGEIVLASHGKLLSCSCAAGPALEGMNISCGMRAAEGAIEDVEITEEGVKLRVIGDAEPTGICGSGILTVTRELLRTGIVRKTGAFVKAGKFGDNDYRSTMIEVDADGKRSFVLTRSPEKLSITMGDVRQVQLAKGAILSGFMALLNRAGIGMQALDKVLIAGQFGAHLPASSITGTGILPFEVEDRIRYVGTTSKTGAYMALMSGTVRCEMEALASEIDYLELGATDNYERLLSECLIFPEFR
ncbi:MAG: DUF4445 domain-containing protein [Mogibacterium sp.]|nr:DUF4445 domain-containing protein [Mogibacterium sp.]